MMSIKQRKRETKLVRCRRSSYPATGDSEKRTTQTLGRVVEKRRQGGRGGTGTNAKKRNQAPKHDGSQREVSLLSSLWEYLVSCKRGLVGSCKMLSTNQERAAVG